MNPTEPQPLSRFLAPRFWPLLAGIGLMRLLVLLPYPILFALGRGIGSIAYYLLPERRHIADVNLRLCFPELDDAAHQRLLRETFAQLGVNLFDFGLAIWASNDRVDRLVELRGIENLQKELDYGRGVILLSGHFTANELCGRRIHATTTSCGAMFRPNSNPLINELMRRARAHCCPWLLTKRESRQMLKLLRQGGNPVWYASDQVFRGKGAALIPFFGEPAITNTALSQIARAGKAAVVPFLPSRLPGGKGLRLEVLPALDNFPTEDPVADAARVHELFERHIRDYPAQYWWVHRRFKDRPGLPDPYTDKPQEA